MTDLRTTSFPIWLPRFKRAALPGLVLFFAAVATASGDNSAVDTRSSAPPPKSAAYASDLHTRLTAEPPAPATSAPATSAPATSAEANPVSATAQDPNTAATANATTTGDSNGAAKAEDTTGDVSVSTADSISATAAGNVSATTGTPDNASATAEAAGVAKDATASDGVSLGDLRWDYKDAAFFKRISEYFTGRENTGYRLILRTDPQQRAGLYFQATLSKPIRDLPEGSALVVRFARPDKAEGTVTHTFQVPEALQGSNKTQLWLGFTGADTPPGETPPTAWQVSVVDAAGKQLAEVHSFLWSARNALAD